MQNKYHLRYKFDDLILNKKFSYALIYWNFVILIHVKLLNSFCIYREYKFLIKFAVIFVMKYYKSHQLFITDNVLQNI